MAQSDDFSASRTVSLPGFYIVLATGKHNTLSIVQVAIKNYTVSQCEDNNNIYLPTYQPTDWFYQNGSAFPVSAYQGCPGKKAVK